MTVRRVTTIVALATLAFAGVTTPAFAEGGPPVPPGCTFDQANGILTCATTSTGPSESYGPYTATQAPTTQTFGVATGLQICSATAGAPGALRISVTDLRYTAATVTTTTITRHGLHGRQLSATSTSRLAITDITWAHEGALECSFQ